MATYIEVPLPEGGALIVQSDEDVGDGVVRAGRVSDVAGMAAETFDTALERLKGAAESVARRMETLANRPDEVTVQFAVKLATEVGVVIANSSAEANLTLTLRWTKGME